MFFKKLLAIFSCIQKNMEKISNFRIHYLFILIFYLQQMGALVGAEFLTLFKGFMYIRKIVAFLFTARPFVFVFFPVLFFKKKVFKLV